MEDIYITNISTVEPSSNSSVTVNEEKTSWDIRQMFKKVFTENNEKFGQIERIYITNSSNADDETYIGFMSMVDTGTHTAIVDKYDGKMFKGRPLRIRMSNTHRISNRATSADDPRNSKDIIDELTEEKNKIENRINNELKKRNTEKQLEEREKEVAVREAIIEKKTALDLREKNMDAVMSEKIRAILANEREIMEKYKAKSRDERLKIIEETLKRESVLRTRERRVSEREEKLGTNLFDQETNIQDPSNKQDPNSSLEQAPAKRARQE